MQENKDHILSALPHGEQKDIWQSAVNKYLSVLGLSTLVSTLDQLAQI